MRRVLREAALTLGALAGLAGVALAVATLVFGVTPVVVTSGSMEPAIGTGSLAFTRAVDADELAVGDVVSVVDANGQRVMHRVESIEPGSTDTERTLTLRGDANGAADVDRYIVDHADRVGASIGGVGHVLTWLAQPAGTVTVGALVVLLLLVGYRPPEVTRPPTGHRLLRAGASAVVVALVAASTAAGIAATTTSRAAWQDTGTAESGEFTTHTVISQAAPSCTNEGGLLGLLGSARLTWPHVDTRYEYAYTITRVTAPGAQVAMGTVRPTGNPAALDVTAALLSLTIGGIDYDVEITSRLSSAPAWTAETATVTRVHSANLLVGLSARCGSA